MDLTNNMRQTKQKFNAQYRKALSQIIKISLVLAVSSIVTGCVTYGIGVGLGSHGHSSVAVGTSVHAHSRRKSRAHRADKRTHKEIIRILAGYRLNTRQIRVKVSRGLVTLRGTVQSRNLEHDIISRIARLPGVHTVRSKMYVRIAYR